MDVPFQLEHVYNASKEKVWEALTSRDAMQEWYFPQLTEFIPVVGFDFVFSDDGSKYQKQWSVTKVEDGRLFAHSWIYRGYPGISEVTFELVEEGNKTRLRLTHTGLASFPADPHFARQRFEDGWRRIITFNLTNYL